MEKVSKMTCGNREIKGIGSFSLEGYIPPLKELFDKAESVSFSGVYDPSELPAGPLPYFEIGKDYELKVYEDETIGTLARFKCVETGIEDGRPMVRFDLIK